MTQKTIGITLGDPAGIGPEIIEKTLAYYAKNKGAHRLKIIGSTQGVKPGVLSKKSAQCALNALEESVSLLHTGQIHAVVNAPVHKKNLSRVGFTFPGQTEFYAIRAGLKPWDVTMMLQSHALRVSLVSTHASLADAVKLVTPERILLATEKTYHALTQQGIAKPRIAICGLNPHAGEDGLLGSEEQKIIKPTIQKLRRKKWNAEVTGPHPADTVFYHAYTHKRYDAIVCMYHDQGLIPLKMTGFENGVNLSLGLPFVRASPDHGTATDIAGQGIANPSSMIAAIRLVEQLIA